MASVREIEEELAEFDDELASRERWLVLNKCDLLDPESLTGKRDELVGRLHWGGRVHAISAATTGGCQSLVGALMQRLDELAATSGCPARAPDREEAPDG